MGDIEAPEPELERQGDDRNTRFDPSADGGDVDDAENQQVQAGNEHDNEFDELTGYPEIRVNQALPTLIEWLAARGVSAEPG